MSREVFDFVVRKVIWFEGGLSTDRTDPGNWTGGAVGRGRFVGTKYGISAASYPNLDIPNLTIEQAVNIYWHDYWLKAGCDELAPALALLHFDAAVNHGVDRALAFLRGAKGSRSRYLAARLRFYTQISTFSLVLWRDTDGDGDLDPVAGGHGRGWVNRMAKLLNAMEVVDEKFGRQDSGWKLVFLRQKEDGTSEQQVFDLSEGDDIVQRTSPSRRRHYIHIRRES